MPDILRVPLKVVRLEERFVHEHVEGFGPDAILRPVSIGWFIVFNNFLSLPCGPVKPDFKEGDPVRLSIEKL
jgi:hypothetical protein